MPLSGRRNPKIGGSLPRVIPMILRKGHSTIMGRLKLAARSSGMRANKPRARDFGIALRGSPGPWNAITDVSGVEIGFASLVHGEGKLIVGKGPVRTGVTAVLPRGRQCDPVFAATYALNGNGEMTGTIWIEESGFLDTPLLITNTFSVGVVRD